MRNFLQMIRKYKFNSLCIAVLLLLAGFLILSAFYAEVIFDEFYYHTVTQRFFAGDRLIVDEWYIVQLSSLFLLLPDKLFLLLTGGTDGIVLFSRFLFIGWDLALYWFLSLRFRKKTAAAPIAAGLFCADIFAGIITFNYYNISLHMLAVTAMLLFLPEGKIPAFKIVFAGVAFAVGVMLEPGFAAVYLLYSVTVLLREALGKAGKRPFEKWAFALNGRTWLLLTLGAAICAAALFTFLALSSGVEETLRYLPESISGSEYGFRWYGHAETPEKLHRLLVTFGLQTALPLLALLPAAAIVKKKNARYAKCVLFFLTLLFWGAACLLAVFGSDPYICQVLPFPCAVSSLVFYILCEKKDPRVFAIWLLGAFCSAAADYLSSTSLFFAFRLAYFPAVFFGVELFRELLRAPSGKPARETPEALPAEDGEAATIPAHADGNKPDDGKHKHRIPRRRPVFRAAAGVMAALLLLNAGLLLFTQTDYMFLAKLGGAAVTAQNGPDKGLRNLRFIESARQDKRTDLDYIGLKSTCPLYVMKRLPDCYLYLHELPIAAYSACYTPEDVLTKQIRYWQTYPEKLPEYIYIPYGDEVRQPEELREILKYCKYRITGGLAGYIVRVTEWRLPDLDG